jgi:hypothetical protein
VLSLWPGLAGVSFYRVLGIPEEAGMHWPLFCNDEHPDEGYWKNKTNFLKELDRIEKLLGITQVIRIYISQILRSSPNFQQ